MTNDGLSDNEKIQILSTLYDSLSEAAKTEYAAGLIQNQDLMDRLMGILSRMTSENTTDFEGTGTFIDFLRSFRED